MHSVFSGYYAYPACCINRISLFLKKLRFQTELLEWYVLQAELCGPNNKGCFGGFAGLGIILAQFGIAAERHSGSQLLIILTEEMVQL